MDATRKLLVFLGVLFPLGYALQYALLTGAGSGEALLRSLLLLTPVVALLAAWMASGGELPDLGLGAPETEHVVAAALVGVTIPAASFYVAWASGVQEARIPWELAERFGPGWWGVAGMVLWMLVAGGGVLLATVTLEELGWRGLLVPLLREAGVALPGMVAAFLFMLWRFPLRWHDARAALSDYWAFPLLLAANLFAVGIVLGRERIFTGCLWPAVAFKASLDMFHFNLLPLFNTRDRFTAELLGPAGLITSLFLLPIALWLVVAGQGPAEGSGHPPPDAAPVTP